MTKHLLIMASLRVSDVHGNEAENSAMIPANNEKSRKRIAHVDHSTRNHHITHHVSHDVCVPCIKPENRLTVSSFLWNFIKSEAFLFFVNMVALAFGVVSAGLRLGDVNKVLELIMFLISTIAVAVVIIIRIVTAWSAYHNINNMDRKSCARVENSHVVSVDSVWPIVFTIIGVTLAVFITSCFLIFKFVAHLHWTIISNNFATALIAAISNVYMTRIKVAMAHIKQDEQHIMLIEGAVLLQKSLKLHTKEELEWYGTRVQGYVSDIHQSKVLEYADHIEVAQDCQEEWKAIKRMQTEI